ncbi:YqaA family protein [Dokdonella immobilis]|uniref:Membrane protein YqaA, SNARE-associated domain n=1 Tax=Dokdonella immobilis TaxID=578942 RepID=A0A1I4V4Q0_9GAMM|nr:YqaA family protein [Dokdonella immobilis]SFM96145.1 membrane protein YqaA, SNARE-associated domain [Dokdonella immobilis]
MKLFKPLYEKALQWSVHPRAEPLLAGLSFVEAIIFPVMPEVMLGPMVLARPRRWARLASISLVFSVIGALVGYALGHYAFAWARPLFESLGWMERIDRQVAELSEIAAHSPWAAFWILVAAGFLPIPLKIFTWASGIVGVPLLPFVASMIVGRGKRVYLLAGVIRLAGPRAEAALHRWIEWIGWGLLAVLAIAILYFKFVR